MTPTGAQSGLDEPMATDLASEVAPEAAPEGTPEARSAAPSGEAPEEASEVGEELMAAIDELACAPTVLVASDFDGVLAPLVLDPMESRPLPGTIESLRGLAALPSTHAAVVSGRDLDTLTELTGLADSAVTRIGSHGAESSAAGAAVPLTEDQRADLERLTAELAEVMTAHSGAVLEHKPSAVVLHTRRMFDESAARDAEAAALEVTARHTGLHVLHGKHVVEVSVVRADKGSALVALREEVGADAVAYFGDDVTDEDAFRALGPNDLTVKVGHGDTAARFRVATPEDAAEALRLVYERRSGR
jgi:trehalose 6-phosphate phosphatase